MKANIKTIIFYLVFIAVIVGVVILILTGLKGDDPTYSQVIEYFENIDDYYIDGNTEVDAVKTFELNEDGKLKVETVKGEHATVVLQTYDFFFRDFYDYVKAYNEAVDAGTLSASGEALARIDYKITNKKVVSFFWVNVLPYILLFGIVIAFTIFMVRQTGGGGKAMSFARAKVKVASDNKNRVYFKDVAGCDEEKDELQEIVEFLRDPSRFTKLGARIPHGVLLMGPPGTGKTLLAKAVAGEAGVPFFSISGSDFVEMYVGVGASRVRDLFETARKHPASIIFIDEIDAVGRHRGAGLGGGHDEREQTLNQLLVEMDGFSGNDGTIVMAATNRPDILDPALLRPGRFDRQVTIPYPDLHGREEILKVHARNKPLEKSVDLNRVAQLTVGFTGADLANLLNEAALLAARKGKSLIGANDIEESTLKVMMGTPKKSRRNTKEELRKTAYHEAGHAILSHIFPTQDPVRQITIVPVGRALGYTLNVPDHDKYSVYKQELLDEICVFLGGRVAEKIVFDDISGGASQDIEQATKIARNMVTRLGMSDLGPVLYGSEHSQDEVFLGRDYNSERTYSEETAAKIDSQIHDIITAQFERAEKLLTEYRAKLDFIAEFLLKNETMDADQFKAAMDRENPTIEELEEINSEKRRISEEENEKKRRIDEEEKAKRESDLEKHDASYRESLKNDEKGGFFDPEDEDGDDDNK